MFTTLIESTPHRKPSGGAGLVSALFHSALIAGAIYATASGAASRVVATAGTQAQKVLWLKPSAQPQSAPAPKPKAKPRPVVAPTKVPTSAPRLDPNAQPTPEPDAGATSLVGGGTPGAFNSFEVDVEVVAVAGTIRPQYPEMLRSSGTQGQVIAQFVVNEKGRADSDTFRVLSSTHPQFTAAVNRALPYMRFKPAMIRGKPVSQLVQQLFVFRLDR